MCAGNFLPNGEVSSADQYFMNRCIQLAYNGLGSTFPNPLVGSVIVCQGKVIGEGWHQKAGNPHAEVNAINSVKNKELLKQSTLYVNLEPCSHYGKTPPCADLIVKHKIGRVVIGSVDPFAKVAGSGIKRLKENGCEVVVGVLENQCHQLNKRFFTFHQKSRPYIFLKWAETKDGFIAPLKKDKIAPEWITNSFSRQYVHKLRSQEQAILVGTNTILHDNPTLNTRHWFGNDPLRVVIDRNLKIPRDFSVWKTNQSTLFLTEEKIQQTDENISFAQIDFSQNLPRQICEILYQKQIQSLIVEGGKNVLQQFIDANLWDEAWIFVGNKIFKQGVKSPDFQYTNIKEIRNIREDKLIISTNKFNI